MPEMWQAPQRNSKQGTFHIHHIVSFKNKELRTNINNLVLLCDECHHWVHSNNNVAHEFIKEDLSD